jgi:hypothetical protein
MLAEIPIGFLLSALGALAVAAAAVAVGAWRLLRREPPREPDG